MKFIENNSKNMANGHRNLSRKPLTDEEISYIRKEIKRICADESVFIMNDPEHIYSGTCYNFIEDRVYVSKNVLPDMEYSSTHPRDIMSVAAVLAHEYYGHRTYREEYLSDYAISKNYHTVEIWQDECRASITAAQITPNLTEKEKADLVTDAIRRAEEYNHLIEMTDFMKEALYGYKAEEKNITPRDERITFISKTSKKGLNGDWDHIGHLSHMQKHTRDNDDIER